MMYIPQDAEQQIKEKLKEIEKNKKHPVTGNNESKKISKVLFDNTKLTEVDCFRGLKRLNVLSKDGEDQLSKLEGDEE